jgi:hypothetical protein
VSIRPGVALGLLLGVLVARGALGQTPLRLRRDWTSASLPSSRHSRKAEKPCAPTNGWRRRPSATRASSSPPPKTAAPMGPTARCKKSSCRWTRLPRTRAAASPSTSGRSCGTGEGGRGLGEELCAAGPIPYSDMQRRREGVNERPRFGETHSPRLQGLQTSGRPGHPHPRRREQPARFGDGGELRRLQHAHHPRRAHGLSA